MKNTMRCLAIIALAAVIGFSFTACGGGGDDDDSATYTGYDGDGAEYKLVIEKGSGGNSGGNTGGNSGGGGGNSGLNGTWFNESGEKWVLNNGSFTASDGGDEFAKGTYTTSGSNITITITQVKGAVFGSDGAEMGLSPTQWYTRQQLRTAIINYAVSEGLSQSYAAEIADETVEGIFVTLTGTYSGNTLTIDGDTFTKGGIGAFAVSLNTPDDRALKPKSGDNYTLTIGGSSTSTGTVSSVSGSTLTLEHRDGGEFTVNVSGKNIKEFYDDIPLDSGGTSTNPGTLTPRKPSSSGGGGGDGGGSGGGGGPGQLTITGLPESLWWNVYVYPQGTDILALEGYQGIEEAYCVSNEGKKGNLVFELELSDEYGLWTKSGNWPVVLTGTAGPPNFTNLNLWATVNFTNGSATVPYSRFKSIR